jgi:hypothetical protein
VSLAHVRGFTHEQLRDRFKPLEAETIRYPNPNDPIGYTTLVVRWPVGSFCGKRSATVAQPWWRAGLGMTCITKEG